MKTKSIKQSVIFQAAPHEVYDLIMNSKKHGAFTGGKVSVSKKINGQFNIFDGYVRGYNIELMEGNKIVQAWHFTEDGWPEDHFSICTFQFENHSKGTKLNFVQTGVPEHKVQSLKDGWKRYYWEPMKQFLTNIEKKK
ncbi:MAG: SRPBCC family protein [Flavobacteriales bacterium]|nr:SRPBCC family protein [Flavobacteriales bacterium]